jgi:hypothetical protein
MIYLCVLKKGGAYDATHVERLRRMIPHPVICLTDDEAVRQPALPLTKGWLGWWSKLELFLHKGQFVYFDLDVTIQRLDWVKELDFSRFSIMEDAFKPNGCPVNSSIMAWTGPRHDLIDNFTADQRKHPGGDQDWIFRRLKDYSLLTSPIAVSFKKHGLLPEAGVVVYHGKPKPWDTPA